MKKIMIIGMLIIAFRASAQELFVFTEPASNMPAKSLGIRTMHSLMQQTVGTGINYHLMPELMWGINKNWMVHLQGFFSNRNNALITEGGSVYAKYRFLSIDDIHSHFRMAAYGRLSKNNADIHQEEIETMGHNTGYELGMIATKLIHKVAISGSLSYERAGDNTPDNKFPIAQSNTALNYTFSIGKLVFPKEYKSYKQVNLNLMLELLGQSLNGNGKSYLDIAPAAQLIINSQARIDLAYRKQLYSNMQRTAPDGVVLKFEYTIFNLFNNVY